MQNSLLFGILVNLFLQKQNCFFNFGKKKFTFSSCDFGIYGALLSQDIFNKIILEIRRECFLYLFLVGVTLLYNNIYNFFKCPFFSIIYILYMVFYSNSFLKTVKFFGKNILLFVHLEIILNTILLRNF